MKSFVYPAVLFEDKDTNSFSIAIYDLGLFCEGATVEEAHNNMTTALTEYFKLVVAYGLDYNPPTPYEQVIKDFKKQLVILVEAKINDTKVKKIN